MSGGVNIVPLTEVNLHVVVKEEEDDDDDDDGSRSISGESGLHETAIQSSILSRVYCGSGWPPPSEKLVGRETIPSNMSQTIKSKGNIVHTKEKCIQPSSMIQHNDNNDDVVRF